MSAQIPVYRYTIALSSDEKPAIVDAISFREEPPWIIFDDTRSSVLVLRAEKVDSIARGPIVGQQLVDELTDQEPAGD